MESPFKTLTEIAAALHVSHETARRAALKGRLPAFQPFGKGTTWCVRPDYESFLAKARDYHGDGPGSGPENTSDDFKAGLWLTASVLGIGLC